MLSPKEIDGCVRYLVGMLVIVVVVIVVAVFLGGMACGSFL